MGSSGLTDSGLTVLAVDPGGVTGWAKLVVDERKVRKGENVSGCVAAMAYGQLPIVGGSGTSGDAGPFGKDAAEERVARLLYDLAVGPRPSVWSSGRPSRGDGFSPWFAGDDLAFSASADVVVFEDFVLRENTMSRSLLAPVRMTHAFRGMAWIGCPSLLEDEIVLGSGSVPRWSIQSPSDGKSVVTSERLKRWGFWIKGQQHARDAVRHGVLWIMKNRDAF